MGRNDLKRQAETLWLLNADVVDRCVIRRHKDWQRAN